MIDLQSARRIAAAYPAGAVHTPRWEREAYLTETQQLAWLIRFDPAAAAEALSARPVQDHQIFRQNCETASVFPTTLPTTTAREGNLHG